MEKLVGYQAYDFTLGDDLLNLRESKQVEKGYFFKIVCIIPPVDYRIRNPFSAGTVIQQISPSSTDFVLFEILRAYFFY